MKKNYKILLPVLLIFSLSFGFSIINTTQAVTPPDRGLGAADSYSVFGKAGVTNTGANTHLWGNVGADSSVIGLTAPQVDGAIITDGDTAGVATDASSTYDSLMDASQGVPTGLDLAGTNTITPGVYDVAASTLNGALTLDGEGVYIFRSSSSNTTAHSGTMNLINGACASDVFWAIADSMTIGTGAAVEGTIIAQTGLISLATGATLKGRAISLISQVTLDDNQITEPVCDASPGTLNIIKTVVNDNGGTAVASDFTIEVTGTNVSNPSFAGSEAGVEVTLDAGAYAVTEPVVAVGYLQTGSGDCSGTISSGQTKTCTITNDDIAPQLIVNKVIVNDNDGTKVISDFPLFIDGNSVTSGVASTTTIGLHTVSETSDSGYTTTIGGNCAADGTITLALGDVKTCTVTNDDITPVVPPSSGGGGSYVYVSIPPLIDVVKVPSPLALPDGSGSVKYTYTLSNIGTVSMNDVTMVGDTCSPITLISGDANANTRLDVNETWVYTCSTILTKTHTNIVTASGWGNGINATDVANATVIVGVPVVPPLIHVTKVPSPLVLSAGGGMITYTNKVTNPGTVALSNVRLIDDKCDPVKYISGDTNGDLKLDVAETWTYTCQTKLTQTTVNTVTASGEANDLTARDFAIATVVVNAAVPKLPNTGLSLNENDIPWNIILPTGIFTILTLFYFVRKKQTA
jgi:hypothetical protein